MCIKIIGFFLYVILLLADFSGAAGSDQGDYHLGDGDVIKVSVYDNPDLDSVLRIDAGGNVQFPLIGQINISGLNVSEVGKKIEHLLSDGYLVNPQVLVFIEEYRSKRVVFNGQVRKPGVYELSGPTSLLELLSKAGGLTEKSGDKLTISRKSFAHENGKKILHIDLKRLLETGDSNLNVTIMDGDSLFIPRAGMVFVIGEVARPSGYKYEEGATVLKVISMAGDFAKFAAKKKIRIIRKIDGKEQVLNKVSMQEPVLPGDIIEVPESFF